MVNYKNRYLNLFNSISNAIDQLDRTTALLRNAQILSCPVIHSQTAYSKDAGKMVQIISQIAVKMPQSP